MLPFTILFAVVVAFLFSGYLGPARVRGATAYAGSEYTLDVFPEPFVKNNSQGVQTYVLIPSSSPHGPCGCAHTMDTMGGVIIAYTLGVERGKANVSESLEASMGCYDYISTYDAGIAKVTMEDTTSNLIVIGGPGVNQATYYYNELRDEEWNKVLPVVYERGAEGDYLYVQSSGTEYYIERDQQGRVTADYGVIQIFRDGVRYVLIVFGLGGDGTQATAQILSDYKNWDLSGRASIIKYYDSDSDGFLDTMSIVESVEPPEVTVELYYDSECTNPVSSIDWEMIEPGTSSNFTIYVKNLCETSVVLSLNTQNWDPSEAALYMFLDWNYTGAVLEPGDSIPIMLTLSVSEEATGINDFSFEIVVTGEG